MTPMIECHLLDTRFRRAVRCIKLSQRALFLMVAAISILAASQEVASAANKAVAPHYFLKANLKARPSRLSQEIAPNEAVRHTAYYVAIFLNDGRISVLCKVLRGRINSRTEYEYEGSGTPLKETSFNGDGSGYSLAFNKSGDIISHEQWPAGKINGKLVFP